MNNQVEVAVPDDVRCGFVEGALLGLGFQKYDLDESGEIYRGDAGPGWGRSLERALGRPVYDRLRVRVLA